MKNARLIAAVLTIGAAILVAGLVAGSSAGSTGVSALHLYERPGPVTFINNAPKGKKPGRGDVLLYAYPVFDRDGTQVGPNHMVCTMLSSTMSQCDSTIVLPKGEIATQGLQGPNVNQVAVVGGTATYAGARGTMSLTPIKGGGSTLLISLM